MLLELSDRIYKASRASWSFPLPLFASTLLSSLINFHFSVESLHHLGPRSFNSSLTSPSCPPLLKTSNSRSEETAAHASSPLFVHDFLSQLSLSPPLPPFQHQIQDAALFSQNSTAATAEIKIQLSNVALTRIRSIPLKPSILEITLSSCSSRSGKSR